MGVNGITYRPFNLFPSQSFLLFRTSVDVNGGSVSMLAMHDLTIAHRLPRTKILPLTCISPLSVCVSSSLHPQSIADGLDNSTLLALIQIIKFLHILFVQLESIDVRIRRDSTRSITFRQRYESLLQTVTDKDLARRFGVLVRDSIQCLIISFLIADERTISFDDDVIAKAVYHRFALLTPGVELTWYQDRLTWNWDICIPRSD